MNPAATDANILIDQVDAGANFESCQAIALGLLRSASNLDPLCMRAIELSERDQPLELRTKLLGELWMIIDKRPREEQAPFRISVCLLHEDQDLDWEIAEYLIMWGREIGLSEAEIIAAFRAAQH